MAIVYETIRNPVRSAGADPWVVRHGNRYYYCYSAGNGVWVAEVTPPFCMEKGSRVYTAPEGTVYSREYWAPELHYLDGAWYIYVAADDGDNANHRMYVLKGTTKDPTDPFEMVGKITDKTDKWAIDGTVLHHCGQMYFVWSGWEGDVNVSQNLYVAHMSDPCTIDGERVLISKPTYPWEAVGGLPINEGPAALVCGGKTYLVYSASGSTTDEYCLGMLTLTGEDPLDPAAWEKGETPVFSRTDSVFGPGHCSFTTAADDGIWMIYHANLVSGTGWWGRSVWLSPVRLQESGVPDFGRICPEISYPVFSSDDKTK
jgi:GH43 family beta-xylosidase